MPDFDRCSFSRKSTPHLVRFLICARGPGASPGAALPSSGRVEPRFLAAAEVRGADIHRPRMDRGGLYDCIVGMISGFDRAHQV